MDHAGGERSRFLIHRFLLEDAVESPIDVYFLFTGMPDHPEEPVFYCSAVKIFDEAKDSQDGSETCPCSRDNMRSHGGAHQEFTYGSRFERFNVQTFPFIFFVVNNSRALAPPTKL